MAKYCCVCNKKLGFAQDFLLNVEGDSMYVCEDCNNALWRLKKGTDYPQHDEDVQYLMRFIKSNTLSNTAVKHLILSRLNIDVENDNISSTTFSNNTVEKATYSNSSDLFDNIGSKIKTLAQVLTWVGIIISVIWGIVIMATDEDLIFAGLMIAVFGSLGSWISSFALYGFGQLIENTDNIVKILKKQ